MFLEAECSNLAAASSMDLEEGKAAVRKMTKGWGMIGSQEMTKAQGHDQQESV